LGLKVFLTLEDGSDIALEFNDLASDGECRLRANQATSESAREHGAGKDEDVTGAHDKASRKREQWDKEQGTSQYSNLLLDEGRSKWVEKDVEEMKEGEEANDCPGMAVARGRAQRKRGERASNGCSPSGVRSRRKGRES
jgi:hypothetical protein